jgi:F-type H+-transporting ATPase subunit b
MEEAGLLSQLGINLSLFLSQTVNFFILLVVLTFFVYKPLIKVIKERNKKIKEGLDKAEEADIRLKEIDGIAKGKIKEAEQQSINMIKATEEKAKALDQDLTKKAEEHQQKMLAQIKLNAAYAEEEAKKEVLAKAADLVKKAIVKTVELDPHVVDQALIQKAVSEIKNEN